MNEAQAFRRIKRVVEPFSSQFAYGQSGAQESFGLRLGLLDALLLLLQLGNDTFASGDEWLVLHG